MGTLQYRQFPTVGRGEGRDLFGLNEKMVPQSSLRMGSTEKLNPELITHQSKHNHVDEILPLRLRHHRDPPRLLLGIGDERRGLSVG
jgi:hypothetical protein